MPIPKYARYLERNGFNKSQVDFVNPGLSGETYKVALNNLQSADFFADLAKPTPSFQSNRISNVSDFLLRYAKPSEAMDSYLTTIIETFKRETKVRQIQVLKDERIDEDVRALLFAKLELGRQQEVFSAPDFYPHSGSSIDSLSQREILQNKRIKCAFLKHAADDLAKEKTTGYTAILSGLSIGTLGLLVAGVLTGVFSGVVFAGVGLGAAPFTVGACYLHYAATKIFKIGVNIYEQRKRDAEISLKKSILQDYLDLQVYIDQGNSFEDAKNIFAENRDESFVKGLFLGINDASTLQSHIEETQAIIKGVEERNQESKVENIRIGVEVLCMGGALVLLILNPVPVVSVAIVSVVGLYATGKLLESIARDGISIPYVGVLKLPANISRFVIGLGHVLQFPVRYSIIKPYQAISDKLSVKRSQNSPSENKVSTQSPNAKAQEEDNPSLKSSLQGNQTASSFADSTSAAHYHLTHSASSVVGGTVILSSIIESAYSTVKYFFDRSAKEQIKDMTLSVMGSASGHVELGTFKDSSMFDIVEKIQSFNSVLNKKVNQIDLAAANAAAQEQQQQMKSQLVNNYTTQFTQEAQKIQDQIRNSRSVHLEGVGQINTSKAGSVIKVTYKMQIAQELAAILSNQKISMSAKFNCVQDYEELYSEQQNPSPEAQKDFLDQLQTQQTQKNQPSLDPDSVTATDTMDTILSRDSKSGGYSDVTVFKPRRKTSSRVHDHKNDVSNHVKDTRSRKQGLNQPRISNPQLTHSGLQSKGTRR
ncbi:MAG: hypothetical protein VX112_00515 [Pseudomonadota bacterium]|nr:hypothetical protein [Pseudomonadota bacterium]